MKSVKQSSSLAPLAGPAIGAAIGAAIASKLNKKEDARSTRLGRYARGLLYGGAGGMGLQTFLTALALTKTTGPGSFNAFKERQARALERIRAPELLLYTHQPLTDAQKQDMMVKNTRDVLDGI